MCGARSYKGVWALALFVVALTLSGSARIEAQEPTETDLEEISRKLDNPLTSLWSLVIQDNLKVLKGDAIDGSTLANTFFFQPSLPVPVLSDGAHHQYRLESAQRPAGSGSRFRSGSVSRRRCDSVVHR